MTTRGTVRGYFAALERGEGWQSFLAEDMTFTSLTSPSRSLAGKETFLAATKRFYSMIASTEMRDLVVEGEKACALTRYELRPPAGAPFASDVAEVFTVHDGKIVDFTICFDSAPYPK